MTTLKTRLLPFKTEFKTETIEEGLTLREVYNRFVPAPINGSQFFLTVNNQVVPEELWDTLITAKSMIVGINAIPTGSNDGAKIAAIVVMAVIVVAAGGLAAMAYSAIGEGFWAGVAAGGITLVGGVLANLAYNAIYKPPIADNYNTRTVKESKTQFIESASNAIDRFGVIPVNLGTNRMYPKQAALPYTEANGKNNYLRQLFTYGYGSVFISERKIGETLIEKYNEVKMEDRLNGDLFVGTSLYSKDVYQEDLSLLMTYEIGWIERRSQQNTSQITVDFIFQRGLCYYDNSGNKNNRTVTIAIETKKSTEEWRDSESYELALDRRTIDWCGGMSHFGLYNNTLGLNLSTGAVQWFNRSVPEGWVQLGHLEADGSKATKYVDDRVSLIGKYILNSGDFAPVTGTWVWKHSCTRLVLEKGTVIRANTNIFVVTNATNEAFSVTKVIDFPEPGVYDIRVRRNTPDSDDDKVMDEVTWGDLKSIANQKPVNQKDISGSALYVKATDQLNGTVDQYNCIVTTIMPKGYDAETGQWLDNVTSSNPADIFRYVLQSKAFVKRLPDDRIDLEKLEEWWKYCDENGYTFNKIIDSEQSIDDVLNDICAAGFATISKVNGNYSVIIDNERPVISGLVTPRNSSNYKGSLVYPEIPHALRIQFRNADKGYLTDERIVYDTGYDETNAELFERVEFMSCTNADLAYKYGKRYFATVKLQPETHTFDMDFENLTFGRGDRISFVNDVILVGVGQGRVKDLIVDNVNEPTVIKGFTIDDKVTIPNDTTKFGVRIRYSDGSGYSYHLLETVAGETNEFTFAEPIQYTTSFGIGSLCAFVEDGKELDLIVTEIKPSNDHSATITCINYAPERFTPIGEIPAWNSNVTLPEDFYAPFPPELAGWIETDESVMIKNSDGSYTSCMVIPLINKNSSNIEPIVVYRPVGGTIWMSPSYIKREPTQVILVGFDDGKKYDLQIRYVRKFSSQMLSDPLSVANVKFVGGSTPPADVKGFAVTVSGYTGLFEWEPNPDIDISHYVIRYINTFEDVMWRNCSILADKIKETRISLPIRLGTYLIKAVDLLGNESVNATTIISTDEGAFNNIVENLTQQPKWEGVKENVKVVDGDLYLEDDKTDGYYYFSPELLDLGNIYEVMMSSTLIAWVEDQTKIRTVDSIRSLQSVRVLDLSVPWTDDIEMNLSKDNETWSGWEKFTTVRQQFRYAKFRLHLQTSNVTYRPRVKELAVFIDLPDRRESAENIEITNPELGATITYNGAFNNNPSVNITVQNGAVDDRLEYVEKNRFGFTIRIFNATINGYVSRSFDYSAAGYGRVLDESE